MIFVELLFIFNQEIDENLMIAVFINQNLRF